MLVGIRAAESSRRAMRGKVNICRSPGREKTLISPIFEWEDHHVWEYIKSRDIPYCSIYDEGWTRLGCVFCPFESRRQATWDRWPKMFAALLHNIRKNWVIWQTWDSWKDGQHDGHGDTPEDFLKWWWFDNRGAVSHSSNEDDTPQCFAFDQFQEG